MSFCRFNFMTIPPSWHGQCHERGKAVRATSANHWDIRIPTRSSKLAVLDALHYTYYAAAVIWADHRFPLRRSCLFADLVSCPCVSTMPQTIPPSRHGQCKKRKEINTSLLVKWLQATNDDACASNPPTTASKRSSSANTRAAAASCAQIRGM